LSYRKIRHWPQIFFRIALPEIGNNAHDLSPCFGRIREGDVVTHSARSVEILLRESLIRDRNRAGTWTVGLAEGTPGEHRYLQRLKIFGTDRDEVDFVNLD
jgi:hypothetical protein